MVAAGENLFPDTSFMRGIFPRLNYLVTKYHNMSSIMLYILVFEKFRQKRTGFTTETQSIEVQEFRSSGVQELRESEG